MYMRGPVRLVKNEVIVFMNNSENLGVLIIKKKKKVTYDL